MATSYRPQLRSLLLAVNFLVLLLPVSGIFLLKMYESQLIRETEAALIGQAALLSSVYKQEFDLTTKNSIYAIQYSSILPAGSPFHSFAPFIPLTPSLDVATAEILPPTPNAQQANHPADPLSQLVGEKLIPVLKESQRITLCGIRIVDSNGIVVSSSGSEMGMSLIHRQEVKKALQGYYASVLRKRISDEPAPAYSSLSRKGWVRVLITMPIIHDQKVVGAVLLSRSPMGVGKGLYFIRKHLFLGSIIVLSLVLAISWLTTVVISRPLKQLVAQTKTVKQQGGKLSPLRHPGTREVAELSGAISDMANSLQDRADYIQNFARHVSHEFKTPLTSLQGSIELMQDLGQEMSNKDQAHFLNNMDKDVRHLDKLTRGLLDFARADMTSPGSIICKPVEVLEEITEYMAKQNKHVTSEIVAEDATIQMDPEIFRGIVINLVENSILHGSATLVNITLTTKKQEGNSFTQILVSDNGRGIPTANQDKIFNPFFTTARNRGGTGLGLTIIQALIKNHGGRITLSHSNEKGSQFSITLPTER